MRYLNTDPVTSQPRSRRARKHTVRRSRRSPWLVLKAGVLAMGVVLSLAFSALPASAAINRSSCNVSELAFHHAAGAGYWAHWNFACSNSVIAVVSITRNGTTVWSEAFGAQANVGDGDAIAAVKGAAYQIVLSLGPDGFATSGTPQVLNA